MGFPELIGERGIGVPTVALKAEFLGPCRYGETLEWRLEPFELGERSLKLRFELAGPDGDSRARFDSTLVSVDRDTIRSEPWPGDLHAAIEPWLGAVSS